MFAFAVLTGSLMTLLVMNPFFNLAGKTYDLIAGRKLRQEAREAAELQHLSAAFNQQAISDDGRFIGVPELEGLSKKEKTKARLSNLMLTLMHLHADKFNALPDADTRYSFIVTSEKHRGQYETIHAYKNALTLYLQHRAVSTGNITLLENDHSINEVTNAYL